MIENIPLEEKIAFHWEGLSFDLNSAEQLRAWIQSTATEETKSLGLLNIVFCTDQYLHKMNVQYLNHDTLTDVITFSYAEDYIEGDIFISVERSSENAQKFGCTPEEELYRVIIHGVLHLTGYDDKTPEEKIQMTAKEDYYLAKLGLSSTNNCISEIQYH